MFGQCCFDMFWYSSQASLLLHVSVDSMLWGSQCLTISILWEDPQESIRNPDFQRWASRPKCLSSTGIEESAPCCDGYESWPNVDNGVTCGPAFVHMLALDGFGTSKGATTRKLWNWPCVVKMMISGLMIEFRSILASDKRSTCIQLLGGLRLKCQIENSLGPSKLTWSHMQPPTIGIDVAKDHPNWSVFQSPLFLYHKEI